MPDDASRRVTEPDLNSIDEACSSIAGVTRTTPLVASSALTERQGFPVFLKLEHHQVTGSFKLRGASNAISRLSEQKRRAGVVAVSTGNHGRGLAHAADAAGVDCVICMSSLVPKNKIDGIESEGAEVRIVGDSQDDAEIEVARLVAEEGMTHLPPFDHPDIIAGQGTLGIELLTQIDRIDTVVVPVSGGGLVAGVAGALKRRLPEIRVVGVSMERGAAMHASLQAGRPIPVPELPTLADALGGGIGLDNRYTFDCVRRLVDDFVLVSEVEIATAIRFAYWTERQIVEGSGAVGIAALLAGKLRAPGTTVVLVTGGNIDMSLHHRIVSGDNVDVGADTA